MLSNLEAIDIKNQSLNLKSSDFKFTGWFRDSKFRSKFQYKIQKQAIFNLKSVLSNLEAIDNKNQSLNLKSSDFKLRGVFVTLNREASFNIKFRTKQFLI